MSEEKAPGEILKLRYIPIEDVEEKLGVKQDKIQKLIDKRLIRYAEFTKPGAYKRTVHIDPVEVCKVLKIKNKEYNK